MKKARIGTRKLRTIGSKAKVLRAKTSSLSANRWAGVNRGGWVNAEYDRLTDVFVSSLERAQRNHAAVEAFKLSTEELPVLPLYYLSIAAAHTAALEGMLGGSSSDTAWDNVHAWRWVR